MEYNNDCKLRNLKSICFRNLYYNLEVRSETKEERTGVTSISPKKEESTARRKSLFTTIPQFDELTNSELLHINSLRLIDSFFSLHVSYKDEELLAYVSEKILSDMNPNFREIVLPTMPDCNTLYLTLKLWCRTVKCKKWKLFYKYRVDLKKLQCIGDSLEQTENFFQNNSVIFNLNNRYYTLPDCLTTHHDVGLDSSRNIDSKQILPSYSFDSIRSLTSIFKSLKELIKSKNKTSIKISESIHMVNDDTNSSNLEIEQMRLSTENNRLDKYIRNQESINNTILAEIMTKKIRINELSLSISDVIPSKIEMVRNQLEITKSQLEPIHESLHGQVYPSIVRNLQEETYILKEIVCIENINNSIKFSIMGLEFPLSIKELLEICYYNTHDLQNFNIDEVQYANGKEAHLVKTNQINAGLNYIVQLINNIAFITNINLKYKMVMFGNMCYIMDPISSKSDLRALKYPLYYDQELTLKVPVDQEHCDRKFNLQNRSFEIGLDLLNKNLISLINDVSYMYNTYYRAITKSQVSNNIPIDCLDNFLWNLQYLVLLITVPSSASSI